MKLIDLKYFSNQKLKQWSKPFYAVICSFCLEFKYKSLIDERKSVLSVTLIALNLLVGKKSRKKINKKNMLCCLTFYIIKPRVLKPCVWALKVEKRNLY